MGEPGPSATKTTLTKNQFMPDTLVQTADKTIGQCYRVIKVHEAVTYNYFSCREGKEKDKDHFQHSLHEVNLKEGPE